MYGGYWSPIQGIYDKRCDQCELAINTQDLCYVSLLLFRCVVLDEERVELTKDMDAGFITFEEEFNRLPRGQERSYASAAQHPEMNRVSHLVAYDDNRVVVNRSPLGMSRMSPLPATAAHVQFPGLCL